MSEKVQFYPENSIEIAELGVDFPYKLENPESLVITEELLNNNTIAERLNFLRLHHLPSFEHCVRVGVLSVDLSIENNLSKPEIEQTGSGGLLHDIGKCAIPFEILSKASPLTEAEREIMAIHTRAGFEDLKDPVFDGVREIVVAHHEFRTDGPYPRNGKDRRNDEREEVRRNGEKKDRDHAAIVAIADVFDSLYVQRPYHPGEFNREQIEQIIRQTYTGDPKLIDQVLERYQKEN